MSKGLLSEAQKEAMRADTHDAALVLVDDLHHIRELVAQEQPSGGDLRRASNLLRRILVEGDLRKIAVPRLGKIHILAPDLRPLYRANDSRPFPLCAADKVDTHGFAFSALMVNEGPTPEDLPGYDPDALVELRVEPFQNQRILCVRGRWVTRADIIKYVANVAHGTHSGSAKTEEERLIRNIRQAVTVKMANHGPDGESIPGIVIEHNVVVAEDAPIAFRPQVIDLALIGLISTAQFLTTAPDVLELERLIAEAG